MTTPIKRLFRTGFTAFFFVVSIQLASAQSDNRQTVIEPKEKMNTNLTIEPTNKGESVKMVQKNTNEVVDENGNPCIQAYVPSAILKKVEDTIITNDPK